MGMFIVSIGLCTGMVSQLAWLVILVLLLRLSAVRPGKVFQMLFGMKWLLLLLVLLPLLGRVRESAETDFRDLLPVFAGGLILAAKAVNLALLALIFSSTTDPYLAAVELARFGGTRIAVMLWSCMRFFPELFKDGQRLVQVQASRGAAPSSGPPLRRVAVMIDLAIGVFTSGFRRSERVAASLSLAGFNPAGTFPGPPVTAMDTKDRMVLVLWAFIAAAIAVMGRLL